MKQARYQWPVQDQNSTSEDWSKVRYLIKIKGDYRITCVDNVLLNNLH